jgi:hypothetical protein
MVSEWTIPRMLTKAKEQEQIELLRLQEEEKRRELKE